MDVIKIVNNQGYFLEKPVRTEKEGPDSFRFFIEGFTDKPIEFVVRKLTGGENEELSLANKNLELEPFEIKNILSEPLDLINELVTIFNSNGLYCTHSKLDRLSVSQRKIDTSIEGTILDKIRKLFKFEDYPDFCEFSGSNFIIQIDKEDNRKFRIERGAMLTLEGILDETFNKLEKIELVEGSNREHKEDFDSFIERYASTDGLIDLLKILGASVNIVDFEEPFVILKAYPTLENGINPWSGDTKWVEEYRKLVSDNKSKEGFSIGEVFISKENLKENLKLIQTAVRARAELFGELIKTAGADYIYGEFTKAKEISDFEVVSCDEKKGIISVRYVRSYEDVYDDVVDLCMELGTEPPEKLEKIEEEWSILEINNNLYGVMSTTKLIFCAYSMTW